VAAKDFFMRDSVRKAFVKFTETFEGSVATMYLDVKGLVTVAIGNLIDPIGAALDMPFLRQDGSPASRTEIGAEWRRMKTTPSLARSGWTAAAKLATLHLSEEGIQSVVRAKLAQMERYLIDMPGRFPDFESYPADAQLCLLSMSWACGPAFRFPKFEACIRARDFVGAIEHCHMEDSHNPGLRPRNAASLVLLANAAAVEAAGDDPEALHYPRKYQPVDVTEDNPPITLVDFDWTSLKSH
jgi:hypothetical protein